MNTIDAIIGRASPAQLMAPGPSPEQMKKILLAAVSAPDHGLMRPWRFLVIEGDARDRFGQVMADSLMRREPASTADRLDAERKKTLRAPTLLVTATAIQDNPKVPAIEQIVAVGAAAQNAMIAAHALGLGALWRTGPVVYDAQVKRSLGFAEADTIVGILYIGSIGAPGKPREREIKSVTRRW